MENNKEFEYFKITDEERDAMDKFISKVHFLMQNTPLSILMLDKNDPVRLEYLDWLDEEFEKDYKNKRN